MEFCYCSGKEGKNEILPLKGKKKKTKPNQNKISTDQLSVMDFGVSKFCIWWYGTRGDKMRGEKSQHAHFSETSVSVKVPKG